MSTWLLCIATNLIGPMRSGPEWSGRPPVEGPGIDAISCIRTEWMWDGETLIATWFDVLNFELPESPDLRRDRLRAWADDLDRRGPMIITSFGGRHFVPILRRLYLAEDLAYPAVFGMGDAPGPLRDDFTGMRAHLDFARFLGCGAAPELARFLEACGIAPALARASADRTLEGAFLRSIVTFHLSLRVLVSAGRLSHAERRRAEERVLDMLPAFGEAATAVSLGLAARSDAPAPASNPR